MQNELNSQIKGLLPGSARGSIFQKINAYRSDGTHADEWLRLFKFLLLPVSVIFTVAFGLAFHFNLMTPYLGTMGAVVFAVLLTLFIEAAKITAMRWFFRDVWFGLWRQNISSALIVFMGGLISVGGFAWSYYNSTKGVHYVSAYLGETKVAREIIQPPTAEVDANLAATKEAQKKAWGTQWKGTTTWEATKAARRALAVQEVQEKQKLLLLEQAAQQQAAADERREVFIGKVGTLLAFLGGKMEWFQLLILAGMVFCERALWERMKQAGHQPAANGRPASTGFRSYPNGAGAPSPISNEAPQVEYFNRNRTTGNVQPYPKPVNGLPPQPPATDQAAPTVSQCDTDQDGRTARGATVGADALLRFTMNKLQGELANLQNQNGLPVSVVKRMQERVGEMIRAIDTGHFEPSPKEAARFLSFNDRQLSEYADDIKAHGGLPGWRRVIEHLEQFVSTEKTA